jgi:hypothetical protein
MADSKLKLITITQKDVSLYQDIVQLLEDVIDRAKRGDVFAVGIVCLHADQSVGTAWSIGAEEQIHKFIGGIESLKCRAVRKLLEED